MPKLISIPMSIKDPTNLKSKHSLRASTQENQDSKTNMLAGPTVNRDMKPQTPRHGLNKEKIAKRT